MPASSWIPGTLYNIEILILKTMVPAFLQKLSENLFPEVHWGKFNLEACTYSEYHLKYLACEEHSVFLGASNFLFIRIVNFCLARE